MRCKEYAKECMNNPASCTDKQKQYNFAVNKNIFYSDGGFIVQYDKGACAYKDITGACYYPEGEHSGFYYIMSQNDVANQIAKGASGSILCGVADSLADGLDTEYVGNDNPMVFVGVEGATNSGIIGDQYQSKVDFCNYASAADEKPASTGSIGIRLQMVIHIANGQTPIHIDSGRGTDHDPYFIKDGMKH